ncbi:flagellar protein FlbD [Pelagirhabdus alkalitolerans]|uniref:Flagellar protein FlbD n=1 Tax=Pelagirhabdus alkalitolerans TaxID=1612202 RepID=A0A1G6H362_9BACI|nr:flagellar FlbD family protein [Pelagirhabdus alkalitolerans]SDB88719.1 flagellar protein FlbD [Pelagirhabdus alkalitolerans]
MIEVTNFKGDPFTLNAMYIERVQSFPDTTITLINGKKLVVKETEQEIYDRVFHFYQSIGLSGWQQKVGEDNEQ